MSTQENALPKPEQLFDPVRLGKYIQGHQETHGKKCSVTFLVGSGFSKSAGIPLANEIVKELLDEKNSLAFPKGVGKKPPDRSEYAFLMERLGSPKERAHWIKKFVNRARQGDEKHGRLQINWAHLLLATLVEGGYVNRILTTNFDPLIVEALSITGQPIRTYDLNVTGNYCPGTLDEGTAIYLHGQMHSLFLANTNEEFKRLGKLYPSVLQEAIQDSLLVVVGYSGDCDPVLDALADLQSFPRGLWWSRYESEGTPLGESLKMLVKKHETDCHFSHGYDADLFMRKLVIDGMQLNLPDEVMKPFTAARINLERIVAFPIQNPKERDLVPDAINFLKNVEAQMAQMGKLSAPADESAFAEPSGTPSAKADGKLEDLSLMIEIRMAVLSQKWDEFKKLAANVSADPSSLLSQAVGVGYLCWANNAVAQKHYDVALGYLGTAEKYGLNDDVKPWLPITQGIALCEQAKLKGNTLEAERLFAKACEKYAEAVRIKPDEHEAFYNWGTTLFEQAKLKGGTSEADELFANAYGKYAETVRIKPDEHDAFYGWGNALSMQAELKGDTSEADELFASAYGKYAEAVRLKPDKYEASYNWGNALSEQAKLKGDTSEADKLFASAYGKYAEAVQIKPDYHEAFNNWGNALSNQAKLKGDTSEADELFASACGRYAEAVRIKPDKYEAFNNWGTALSEQAKLKGDTSEAERLFTEACGKYIEALRIKPNDSIARFNYACICSLRGQVQECCEWLAKWKACKPQAKRSELDSNSGFDRVRDTSQFKTFRDSLPE